LRGSPVAVAGPRAHGGAGFAEHESRVRGARPGCREDVPAVFTGLYSGRHARAAGGR